MPDSRDPVIDLLIQKSLSASAALHDQLAEDLDQALGTRFGGWSIDQLLNQVGDVLTGYVDPFADLLADANLAAWLTGGAEVAQQVPLAAYALVDTAGSAPPPLPLEMETEAFADEPWAPGRWTWRGLDIWLPLIEEAARDLQTRELVTREEFDQLDAIARARAFTVARLETINAIDKVRQEVTQSVVLGTGFPAFKRALDDTLGSSTLGPGHLENVFRTNIAQSAANGMERIVEHPLVTDLFPYVATYGIDDARQTELCDVITHSGIGGSNIFRRDDPVYRHFRSPRHWRCRCSPRFMTLEDAATKGIGEARKWLRSGQPPYFPDFVPWPAVELPAGWNPGEHGV